jgi:hypothetical protein
MTGSGGAESPEQAGGRFPAIYDDLKRLAAARPAGERSGHSLNATAFREWVFARSWLATAPGSGP